MIVDATDKDSTEPCASTVERQSWEEFRDAGLLWAVNSVLHWFGWCIIFASDETGKLVSVYPARTKWRGFPAASNDAGIMKLTKWLAKAAPSLRTEIDDVRL